MGTRPYEREAEGKGMLVVMVELSLSPPPRQTWADLTLTHDHMGRCYRGSDTRDRFPPRLLIYY